MPLVNGSSGPTKVKSILFSFANSTNSFKSVILIFSHLFSSAVPPLPGATNIKGPKSVVAKPYLQYYGK